MTGFVCDLYCSIHALVVHVIDKLLSCTQGVASDTLFLVCNMFG